MLEYQGSHLMIDEIRQGSRSWLTGEMQKPYGRGINLQIDTDNANDLYKRIKNSGLGIFCEIEDK